MQWGFPKFAANVQVDEALVGRRRRQREQQAHGVVAPVLAGQVQRLPPVHVYCGGLGAVLQQQLRHTGVAVAARVVQRSQANVVAAVYHYAFGFEQHASHVVVALAGRVVKR